MLYVPSPGSVSTSLLLMMHYEPSGREIPKQSGAFDDSMTHIEGANQGPIVIEAQTTKDWQQ